MLFDPLEIRSIHFKNRVAISPMCPYSSIDGFANDWHLVHLGSRAVGGAALMIREAQPFLQEVAFHRMIWVYGKMNKLKFFTE